MFMSFSLAFTAFFSSLSSFVICLVPAPDLSSARLISSDSMSEVITIKHTSVNNLMELLFHQWQLSQWRLSKAPDEAELTWRPEHPLLSAPQAPSPAVLPSAFQVLRQQHGATSQCCWREEQLSTSSKAGAVPQRNARLWERKKGREKGVHLKTHPQQTVIHRPPLCTEAHSCSHSLMSATATHSVAGSAALSSLSPHKSLAAKQANAVGMIAACCCSVFNGSLNGAASSIRFSVSADLQSAGNLTRGTALQQGFQVTYNKRAQPNLAFFHLTIIVNALSEFFCSKHNHFIYIHAML